MRSMGSKGPKVSSCGQRRLISLRGCPGWSESLLGAHVISLILPWGGSCGCSWCTSSSLLNRPGELGLERGPTGAQIGAPGLDELENGLGKWGKFVILCYSTPKMVSFHVYSKGITLLMDISKWIFSPKLEVICLYYCLSQSVIICQSHRM